MAKRIEDIIGKIKKEVDDTGEDVDYIKVDVKEIKKEVVDTAEDIDDIKEDIDDIKEDIQNLHKPSLMKTLTDRFEWDDFAQQVVGALILSTPFAVTEEVWRLSSNLTLTRIFLIVLLTIAFDIVLLYYTKFRKMESKISFLGVPLRIISLLAVSYVASTVILTLFGVIGGEVVTVFGCLKLIVLVGLFANIGASTADLIR